MCIENPSLAAGAPGAGYGGTSNTTYAIGTGGTQAFQTQAGLAYLAGIQIRIAHDGANYIEGFVASYGGTTLSIVIEREVGAGSYNSWNIGIAGDVGDTGATGATGAAGTAGAAGSQIRNGSGPPNNNVGVDGDYYYDNDTGALYVRTNGAYTIAFKTINILTGDAIVRVSGQTISGWSEQVGWTPPLGAVGYSWYTKDA